MRVLMTTDSVGGVWTFTQELASGLLVVGCDVALVSIGARLNADQDARCSMMNTRWGGSFRFYSTDAPLEWTTENERAYTGAAGLLLQVAEEFEPDVLHTNQFCFGALPVPVPRVVTAHSDVLSWAGCCRHLPLEETSWLRRYRALVGEGLALADAVVAPTHWMLGALGRNFSLPERRLVISNGRKIDEGSKGKCKLQAVSAGRLWDEAKGIATLSDLLSPMPLLLVGESASGEAVTQTLTGALIGETTGATTGEMTASAVQSLGALPQQALLALFRESAVYLCTSRYEPFGLAALEAALCGCAVIARDIPSLREVWGDGAIYFSSAEELSQLLHLLCADANVLRAARASSSRRARRYSREAMALGYLALYEEVALRKGELAHVA